MERNLENLRELGVKQLKVTDGQATPVNPYNYLSFEDGYENFIALNIQPLPCLGVDTGTYEIDDFEVCADRKTETGWVEVITRKVNKKIENVDNYLYSAYLTGEAGEKTFYEWINTNEMGKLLYNSIVTDEQKIWYTKLLAKLKLIKSGELDLDKYIEKIENKIK